MGGQPIGGDDANTSGRSASHQHPDRRRWRRRRPDELGRRGELEANADNLNEQAS
jgi:hypothetical protein